MHLGKSMPRLPSRPRGFTSIPAANKQVMLVTQANMQGQDNARRRQVTSEDSSDKAGMGAGAGGLSPPPCSLLDPEDLLKGEGRIRLTFSWTIHTRTDSVVMLWTVCAIGKCACSCGIFLQKGVAYCLFYKLDEIKQLLT